MLVASVMGWLLRQEGRGFTAAMTVVRVDRVARMPACTVRIVLIWLSTGEAHEYVSLCVCACVRAYVCVHLWVFGEGATLQ